MITLSKIRKGLKLGYVGALSRVGLRHQALAGIDFTSGLGDSALLIYGLVRSMKPEVCVEIGSAQGRSACYTALGLTENGSGKLYAIDPHTATQWNDGPVFDTFRIINRNLRANGYAECVEIIRKTSEEAAKGWDRSIDLLFIDGDHTYQGVKRDWELFSPFVKPFGIVIFHDTAWELPQYDGRRRSDLGVPQFVDELRCAGYQVLTVNQDFGVSLVQPTRGGIPLLPDRADAPAG